MEKPGSLRAAIEAYLPELKRDPDKLVMWVRDGSVRCTQGPDLGFTIAYRLSGALVNFTGHPSVVFLAINGWLAQDQPELLGALTPGYRFEVDVIDSQTVDLAFELDLDEVVKVTPREGGGYNLEHPVVIADLDPALTEPVATLQQLWWRGEKLLPE